MPRNIALPPETVGPYFTNVLTSQHGFHRTLQHLSHSYKYLPLLLPEFIFMDFCYFSFQLL